jgi:hypothetical protein
MLDLVPLGGAGREVAHRHRKAGLCREAGQLGLPYADPIAVGSARIGGHQQPGCGGVQRPAGLLPPAPQRRHRERGRVVVAAHAHPSGVSAQVIDPVGDRLANRRVGEVVHVDPLGLASRLLLGAAIGVAADQLLLLGVHAHNWLPVGLLRLGLLVDLAELRVPVGVLSALLGLEGALQRVALLLEQPPPRCRRRPGSSARPARQRAGGWICRSTAAATRVPAGVGVDQLVQRGQQARVPLCQPPGPAPGTADAPARVRRVVQLPHPGVHRRPGQPTDPGHPSATTTAQCASGRAGQQATLLLGQVEGDQLVQPAQHGAHVHAATLPPWPTPTATIRQTSHAGTP